MYDVRLPESLYQQAAAAAHAEHVSVEDFIAQAVQFRLRAEPLTLTPSQMAKVRDAQDDARAGRVFTPEEAKADFETHRNEWLAKKPR